MRQEEQEEVARAIVCAAREHRLEDESQMCECVDNGLLLLHWEEQMETDIEWERKTKTS